jgi:hypothetical protein
MKNALKNAFVLSAVLMSSVPAMANDLSTPLNLGDQFALRGYTGQAIGTVLADVVKTESVGMAANTSSICSSLVGGAASGFVAKKPGGLRVSTMAKPDEAAATFASLKDQAAIAILFGGQVSPEENAAMVQALLSEMARANYSGPVFLHAAVFGGKMAEKAAMADPAIEKYLAAKQNVYAISVNPTSAKALVHQVGFKGGTQSSTQVVFEMPMNDQWLTLVKRSLIKRG